MKKIKPKAGQESVWDYPRPPRVEPFSKSLRVVFNEVTVAQSNQSYRVLETSHPPVYYIPAEHVTMDLIIKSDHNSWCEFKGKASYFHLKVGEKIVHNAGWFYEQSTFPELNNCLAFYASRIDACYVDEERVQAQEGDFYGGWITSNIVGPFKGAPGTWGW
ncbi:MAG: DUF427 domain-containing protein [Leptolyngbya sp. SIO3F4]|nr:DUF427 domain-containing protein [Leptolyngbya sp. SIO3F4]